MIQYEINTGNSIQLSTFYDEWDIAEEDKLYDWNKLTNLDKDKYIRFDDGSNLYTKIYLVSRDYVRTSSGLYRVKDIIHCSKPKYVHWGYSGASDNEESFEVRPPSKNEQAKVSRFLNGHKPRTMTRRVRMLVLDKMREHAVANKLDEEFIISRLKEWASGNGQHAYKSLMTVARIQGIEIEKVLEKQDETKGSIADRLGISGTVQDKRKKLPMKNITNLVKIDENDGSKIGNEDAIYKEQSVDNRAEAGEDQEF